MIDFIIKDGRKNVKCFCPSCGIDRGYHRENRSDRKCRNCYNISKIGVEDKQLYPNVNFNTPLIIKGCATRYQTNCIQCGKDKGYLTRKCFTKPCLSCTSKNNKIGMTEETLLNSKIKISCTLQEIPIEEFSGFVTPERKKLRSEFSDSGLKQECIRKSNYTCDISGKRGGDLQVHHKNAWLSFPDERYDIDNLVCLSEEVHKKFHKLYGSGKNTKEQYEEFKANFNLLSQNSI